MSAPAIYRFRAGPGLEFNTTGGKIEKAGEYYVLTATGRVDDVALLKMLHAKGQDTRVYVLVGDALVAVMPVIRWTPKVRSGGSVDLWAIVG